MPDIDQEQVLALHFQRSLDGTWYATAQFRDSTIGKNGHKVVCNIIDSETMTKLIALATARADAS